MIARQLRGQNLERNETALSGPKTFGLAASVSSNKRQVFKKGSARQHFEILPFQSVDLHRRGNWIYNGDLAVT